MHHKENRRHCMMLFVSFNSNTMGITSGAGTAYPFGSLEYTPGYLFVGVVLHNI